MSGLKDILTDLVKTTGGLDFDNIKVTGTDKETKFQATNSELIMNAKTKVPVKEINGVFGIPNLGILKGYIDIYSSYTNGVDTAVTLSYVERNGVKSPAEFKFEATGQSKASHRLVGENAVSKVAVIKDVKWAFELANPTKSKIQEFANFARVMSNLEKKFTVLSKDSRLLFEIGDNMKSSNSVVVDMSVIDSTLKPNVYPVSVFLTLMNNSSIVLKFSEKGFAEIFVDTGLIEYSFIVLANISDNSLNK